MPKVDAFKVAGLEIFLYSNDHPPPHIHITRRGEWSIKVDLRETAARGELDFEYVFCRRAVPGRVERVLRGLVAEHREELLAEWEDKVQEEP